MPIRAVKLPNRGHAVTIANGTAKAGPAARNSAYGITDGCVITSRPSMADPSIVCGHKLCNASENGTA